MKIFPSDIGHKRFPKKFRGLEEEEVYAFLAVVSESMEELLRENTRMKETIARLESEIKECKTLEVAVFNFLDQCIKIKSKGSNSSEE
ncbi:MAG: DivIVA domain-containing protein [Nitrospirota bacterium]